MAPSLCRPIMACFEFRSLLVYAGEGFSFLGGGARDMEFYDFIGV